MNKDYLIMSYFEEKNLLQNCTIHIHSFIPIHNLLTNNGYINVQIALTDTQTNYTGSAITVCLHCVGYHDNT